MAYGKFLFFGRLPRNTGAGLSLQSFARSSQKDFRSIPGAGPKRMIQSDK
jgi:hypothetical protein